MNRERFAAVLEHIKANPKEWDQESWCGTACCFAGHTVSLFGEGTQHRADATEVSAALIDSVQRDARTMLGLSPNQADYVFDADRTVPEFEAFLAKNGVTP